MANEVKWAKLLKKIYAGESVTCPDCGGNVQSTLYSNDGKIGFAVLQCETCNVHIKFSRINIPDKVKTVRF